MTLSNNTVLNSVVRQHKQRPGAYCSASAHEFIMKLHGKVPPDENPLQNQSQNEKKGFDFKDFLKMHGFTMDEPSWLSKVSAMITIAQETASGRYPLLSIPNPPIQERIDCHIMVAMKMVKEIIVFDPAIGKPVTDSTQTTEQFIESAVSRVLGRDKLNVLTYKEVKPPGQFEPEPRHP